jgi:hypothetical protein
MGALFLDNILVGDIVEYSYVFSGRWLEILKTFNCFYLHEKLLQCMFV